MRYHHHRHDLGYAAAHQEAAPRFGSLLHASLEAWWQAWAAAADFRLAFALKAIAREADAFERAKAEALMFGYHVRWIGEPYDVIAVEAEFRGPLVNPSTGRAATTWQRAGKIDVLVRDRRDGLVRLIEHKTSSEDITPGSTYWRRLRMDGQVSSYYAGARFLGHTVAGCIYDVIGKPALRPGVTPLLDEAGRRIVLDAGGARVWTKDRKRPRATSDAEQGYTLQTRAETPEEYQTRLFAAIGAAPERYYARAEVVRLEAEIREAEHDDWQTAKMISAAAAARAWPRNPDACMRYGRVCEFFDVCTGTASLDDPGRFVRLGATPELTGTAAAGETSEEER